MTGSYTYFIFLFWVCAWKLLCFYVFDVFIQYIFIVFKKVDLCSRINLSLKKKVYSPSINLNERLARDLWRTSILKRPHLREIHKGLQSTSEVTPRDSWKTHEGLQFTSDLTLRDQSYNQVISFWNLSYCLWETLSEICESLGNYYLRNPMISSLTNL